jgi:aspartate/methionine/tyrosine aminotransferase
MINTILADPEYCTEKIKSLFNNLGYSEKEIFGGNVPIKNINYQNKIYLNKYTNLIKFYYSELLKRPLSEKDYIIISNGSLGAFYAVTYALKDILKKNSKDKLKMYQVNKPPSYFIYKDVDKIFTDCEYSYNKNDNDDINSICDVSIIISPNNPTGEIINTRKGKFQIIDEVFNIPIYTNQYKSVNTRFSDNEIYLDSLSKVGFPSYRFGWAITRNINIAKKAWEYMKIYNEGMNTCSFYLSKNIINLFYKYGNFNQFSSECYNEFKMRKNKLINLFKQYELYNDKFYGDYSPFLILPISEKEFKNIGILSRKGSDFLYSDQYSRLNLMITTKKFNKLYNIIKNNKDYFINLKFKN